MTSESWLEGAASEDLITRRPDRVCATALDSGYVEPRERQRITGCPYIVVHIDINTDFFF